MQMKHEYDQNVNVYFGKKLPIIQKIIHEYLAQAYPPNCIYIASPQTFEIKQYSNTCLFPLARMNKISIIAYWNFANLGIKF